MAQARPCGPSDANRLDPECEPPYGSVMRGHALLVTLGVVALAAAANALPRLDLVQVMIQDDGDEHLTGIQGLEYPQSVAVSPDGRSVYAVSDEIKSGIAIFARDPATGLLTHAGDVLEDDPGVSGIEFNEHVTVSPDGRHVYVTSWYDAVTVFARDATTSLLTWVASYPDDSGGANHMEGMIQSAVSPDGAHVYVAAWDGAAVTVFSRNATTGELTFVEDQRDGVGGVDGLNGAHSVIVSPDGRNLYVASTFEDALAVFDRNATTGALTFREVHRDGVAGDDGLEAPWSVIVSPDGRNVYVAAQGEDAIGVFQRDATTGALTFVEKEEALEAIPIYFETGLSGIRQVAIAPSGGFVVSGSYYEDALVLFDRDPVTGALTFAEEINGFDLEEGLSSVTSVTVADTGTVYATGQDDGTVSVVRVHCGSCAPCTSCDGAGSCVGAPRTGCRAPQKPLKSTLRLRDRTPDTGDLLNWTWAVGQATSLDALGDPETDTSYTFCLFDASSPAARLHPTAPAASICDGLPCWKPLGADNGFRYRDKARANDGTESVLLKAGADRKARAAFKGKGPLLAMPSLPLVPPVRAQLQASNGECWEATFDAADVKRNDGAEFRARGD